MNESFEIAQKARTLDEVERLLRVKESEDLARGSSASGASGEQVKKDENKQEEEGGGRVLSKPLTDVEYTGGYEGGSDHTHEEYHTHAGSNETFQNGRFENTVGRDEDTLRNAASDVSDAVDAVGYDVSGDADSDILSYSNSLVVSDDEDESDVGGTEQAKGHQVKSDHNAYLRDGKELLDLSAATDDVDEDGSLFSSLRSDPNTISNAQSRDQQSGASVSVVSGRRSLMGSNRSSLYMNSEDEFDGDRSRTSLNENVTDVAAAVSNTLNFQHENNASDPHKPLTSPRIQYDDNENKNASLESAASGSGLSAVRARKNSDSFMGIDKAINA